METLQAKKTDKIYLYLLPGFIIYILAIVVPLFVCLAISLTNWKGGKSFHLIGLDNYIKLITDVNFWQAFIHNLEFIGILMISQIGIAFLMALFFQSKAIKFKELHRRVIFLPAVLAPMVVGMVWQLVYRNDIGLIASLLKVIGVEKNFPWLNSTSWVIPSICLTLTWQFVGQFVIIIMAGMQNISSEISEAAEIDGANKMQRAFYILFPLLKPTISICMLICISGCMKMFDIVFIMSGGGPGKASMVTALYSYNLAFESHKLGYASATAIGMTILSLLLVLLFQWILGDNKHERE